MAAKNDKLVAVCAAMPLGTGLDGFAGKYGKRFFDVGIAEEHAVTFAGALAADGLTPVVAIYSTFLQRSYDQIIHDVCEAGHHVVFALDRSGLVGNDGETHQGIYDISYLTSVPGLTVMAPKNRAEFEKMLDYAVNDYDMPIAIRYPRGSAYEGLSEFDADIEYGKSEIIYRNSGVLLLAAGSMVETAKSVYDELTANGINASLVNMRFIKPMDTDMLESMLPEHDIVVTLEENVISGGLSEQVAAYMQWNDITCKKCIPVALPDSFIEHGAPDILKEKYGLDAKTIAQMIRSHI